MKHGRKRLLSILLSLVLVLGLMPGMSLTAYADGPIQVSTAEQFLAAVNSGGSVQLTADFDLPLNSYLVFGKAMTLDLNGHTITVQQTDRYCYWSFCASVTIRDGAGGGKIIHPSTSYAFRTSTNGNLTLEGGTMEFTGSGNNGIDVWQGPFTMTGGTIKSVGKSIWRDGNKVTISGGTIIGDFEGSSGDISITGGNFSGRFSTFHASETGEPSRCSVNGAGRPNFRPFFDCMKPDSAE